MSKPMLRLTYDADGAGRQCGRAIIANDEQALHNISAKIDLGHEIVNQWISQRGGKRISGGGDEGSFRIVLEAAKKVEELRKKYFNATGLTISVGIGKDLSEAGRSLLYAKATGKDKIVWYGPKIEKGIEKMRKKVKAKTANQEEMKLADAYLEKSEYMKCDLHRKKAHRKHTHELHKHEEGFHNSPEAEEDKCPYCANDEDSRTDNCSLCADLDAEENADGSAGMHDCPACKEYDAAQQNTGGIDDCPYCQSENISEAQTNPEQDHDCNCPNCPKKDQSGLAVEDQGAQHPDDCPECQELYSNAIENQPDQTGQEDPNMQGHETAEEVLDLLDQEPGTGSQTPAQEAKKIDNTELPQGDQMREGTSVPEDFGDAQKNDISDSEASFGQPGHDCNCPDCPGSQEAVPMEEAAPAEAFQDEPDMSGVLQNGLDEHAQDQKKQQVLDMVAQTLQGFKANKASLEATKEQNQALYNSCIQMLKSMIELCKLLGLEPKLPEQAAPAQEQAAPGQPAPQPTSPSGLAQPASAEESGDPKAMA